ncbi:MAG: hypothetical protein HGA45_14815 [Chloroflexales bacterium]|nr:hypothetical protein [Chloroflexales bacterium]
MPALYPNTPDITQAALSSIEQRLTILTLAIERQSAQIGRIADVLVDLRNRSDWNAAQVGELLRILAAGVREIRETQVYSMLDEGPVTVADLIQLQSVPSDCHEQGRLQAQAA